MNQKQRDYLIKRLQKLAEEKKANFKVEEPNLEPFIKKLKPVIPGELFAVLHKELKPEGYKPYTTDYKRVSTLTDTSHAIHSRDFYSNYDEVQKEVREFCKKHYDVYDKRLISIDKECQIHCDKIVFAESYEEALAILGEFTKF